MPSNQIAKQIQVDETVYDDLKKIHIDVKRIVGRQIPKTKITFGQLITHSMKDTIARFNSGQELFMENLIKEINDIEEG